jgi:hypothetical protein
MSSNLSRFQTEIEFILPKGYIDAEGVLHRHGVMRLAKAADEILPLRDPRVQQNPAYLAVIILSRVIVKLGGVQDIDCKLIENLYAADFEYLQRLYEKINAGEDEDAQLEAAPALHFNGGMRAGGEV